jgi:hypothetical protein
MWPKGQWRERARDNRFSLPEEAMNWLASHKLDAQWITESVYGQRQDQRYGNFLANGWVPAEPNSIPGVCTVDIDGSRLVVRPMAISEKARAAEMAAADAMKIQNLPVFSEGITLPSGAGAHPSAIRSNKRNVTLERFDIPEDR